VLGVFDVDPWSGVIRSKVPLLECVLLGNHELVVQAVDHGLPQLSSTARVNITVFSTSQRPPEWVIPVIGFVKPIREVYIHPIA